MELDLDALQLLPEQEPSGLQPCSRTCAFTCWWTDGCGVTL
ncbi:ALQxL family class IV lanthipeptide [Micromonospora echinofusca]|uniref:Uncharacterized protein n=1 Tax=Micromonospora echinofusca TaxID=47858 RepID=A0A1C5G7D0_MICEH|nr:ALQxL family class IV lanthipeptide [Micromonospora echinofusca]SCG15651.1 hypothetical protein GA0070610_1892 [Micromonospora echinofusca]